MRRVGAAERSGGTKRGIGIEPSGRRTGDQQSFSFIFIHTANLLLLFFYIKGTSMVFRQSSWSRVVGDKRAAAALNAATEISVYSFLFLNHMAHLFLCLPLV